MNIKLAAAAALVCLGAAACDQGERRVADDSVVDQTAQDRADVGAATQPAAGRPNPNAVTDTPNSGTPRPGTTPNAQPDPDSLGQTEAANAVQDAAAGLAGQVNAAVVGGDTEDYLRNAALAGMYEIEAGQIAQEKSRSAAIQQIGRMLVDDHRTLNTDMKSTIMSARISFTPPTALDNRRQLLIDNLEAASAEDFDDVFLEQQESAHEEALILFRSYASRGDIPELKALAEGAIPTLEAHLERVRTAKETLAEAG